MSQRTIWTCKILTEPDQASHKLLAKYFFGKYRNTDLGLNVLKLDSKLNVVNCEHMPNFYFECLQAWKMMKPMSPNPTTKGGILNEPPFDNPKITNINCNGQTSTIFIKSLVDKKIVSIKNVCNGRQFVTPENISKFVFPHCFDRKNKSRICTNYKALISCIPQEWINILRQDAHDDTILNPSKGFTFRNPNLNEPISHKKATTRVVYQALIKSRNPPASQQKWEDLLNTSPQWNVAWQSSKHK